MIADKKWLGFNYGPLCASTSIDVGVFFIQMKYSMLINIAI